MMTPILIRITCESPVEAEKIAREAVERRLAASAHIHHHDSIYRWKGDIAYPRHGEHTVELLTDSTSEPAVRHLVSLYHSYALPVIVIIPNVTVTPQVVEWMKESLTGE